MVAAEPRVRRRGMFFHVETPELDHVEHEAPEGVSIRLRVARPKVERRQIVAVSSRKATHAVRHFFLEFFFRVQISERDWQPSTGKDEPLIQLARGEARNATAAPTSSARPKRPNGSSNRRNSAIPAGSAC